MLRHFSRYLVEIHELNRQNAHPSPPALDMMKYRAKTLFTDPTVPVLAGWAAISINRNATGSS